MASIRRTLSPAFPDQSYQNGGSPLKVNSPSHKLFSFSKHSSATSFPSAFSAFAFKFRRKGHQQWRKVIFRCFLFFLVGFVFGITPFGHVDEHDVVPIQDFWLDVKKPHINARIEDNDGNRDVGGGYRSVNRRDLVVDMSFKVGEEQKVEFVPRKQLIVVTPTYNRAMQAYFLNRMGQVLKLVPEPVLWIVVELNSASMETAEILRKTGVMYRHLVCSKNSTDMKDRGVHQRNVALEHIEFHKLDGIVYFADDDNIYSLELFDRLRDLRRFGTWPVAMLTQSKNKAILEGPVCNGSHVIGWHTNEKSKRLRRFHVDMSGFAFNSTILWDPKRWHPPTSALIRQLDTVKEGFQETTFIEQVVEDESQMEGTPVGCSTIMIWHLHLDTHGLTYPRGWLLQKNLVIVNAL